MAKQDARPSGARSLSRPYRRWKRAVDHRMELSDRTWLNRLRAGTDMFRRYGRLGSTILFYPDRPYPGYKISQICRVMGYQKSSEPDAPYDVAFKWRDETFYTPDQTVARLSDAGTVINGRCNDISKERVSALMDEVFGYTAEIDPATYHGTCIQKSNLNSQDDQCVVEAPVASPVPDALYQKLIRTDPEGGIEELRVSMCAHEPLCVTVRRRSFDDIFDTSRSVATLPPPAAVFGTDELRQLGEFTEAMNLDFGDLDVLRDVHDGRIYVIDVNNTPSQIGDTYPVSLRQKVLEICGRAFERTWL